MNVISTILIVLSVSFLLKFLAKGSKQVPQTAPDGKKILRSPRIYEILAWIFLAFAGFITTLGELFNSKSIGDRLGWLGLFGFFAIMAVPLILSRRNSFVAYNDEIIESTNSFGKKKSMLWKDIKKIDFSPSSKELIFRDEKQKLGVSYSRVGFRSLLDKAKDKLPPVLFGDTEEKIHKFYTAMRME